MHSDFLLYIGYVRWRAWCGLTVPKTFDDLIHVMHELDIHRLKTLYRSDNIYYSLDDLLISGTIYVWILFLFII